MCRYTWLGVLLAATPATGAESDESLRSLRLPAGVPPVIAVWGWQEPMFQPAHYKAHIEMTARHSGVNLLATTIRAPGRLVTDEAVREEIGRAAQHAARFGIGIALDLDVRLAREAFGQAHPDELQEILRLREVALKSSGEATLAIPRDRLSDHYTFQASYDSQQAGRVVRVYAYQRGPDGIKPQTVRDITARCHTTSATQEAVSVSIPCDPDMAGQTACAMVSFTLLTADVFAPHLLSFQRRILNSYRDVPLAGACKDEWGFPPCFDGNPAHDDYWYSRFLAQAYGEQTGGRELLRDGLLMTYGEAGREAERLAAINHFREMCRLRNAKVENDFYDAVKSIWGPEAVVATHPTWWPYPDRREFRKNGLDWWIVRRDWAQTDEITPYCVRTALAKKWGSPVWFNMYYSPNPADYQAEMWAGALTGGRIDYHPLWPVDLAKEPNENRYQGLLRGGLMRGDCRVRLLNFITQSPLDCPVAIVFGQPCAMNWAGPAYDDVGLVLCDALWQAGYPADLIPTTEIWTGSLAVGEDGYVRYGPQRYRAVVLYHPDLDKAATAEFFREAANGQSTLYRIGQWTRNFEGQAFDGNGSLPAEMIALDDAKTLVERVVAELSAAEVVRQARADRALGFMGCRSIAPPARGACRMVDGTYVVVSGVEAASGDPIQRTVTVEGHEVVVDAVGLFAIRLDKQGKVDAVAAGGLKSLRAGELKIDLPERVDLALWHDRQGHLRGVLQDGQGQVPAPLLNLTERWLRLSVPVPHP